MGLRDKNGVLGRLDEWHPLVVEVGCGPKKRHPRSIGIDALDYPAVDIVGDAFDALRALPEGSADLVTSSHFLEHVHDLDRMLDEMIRVTRVGGLIEVIVPHFSHPYFYSDPTHVIHFGLYTFSYLALDTRFRRIVPAYSRREGLELRAVRLVFKSTPPFYVRHAWKKLLELVFNSSRWMQEFYEENLCYMFPCYEIRFSLRKTI